MADWPTRPSPTPRPGASAWSRLAAAAEPAAEKAEPHGPEPQAAKSAVIHRALLYAQRLWALDRKAPRGLWLAYVLDMIGADWLALPVIAAADELTKQAAARPPAWRRTLDDCLRHPESGLGPAHARAEIAEYLVDEGKPREALEYARAAAESFSQRSLQALAYAFEGLGEVEEASRVYAAIHERYGGSGFEWHGAMIRMRADRTTPRDLLSAAAEADRAPHWLAALLAEAEGKPAEAIDAWERQVRAAPRARQTRWASGGPARCARAE